MNGEVVQELTFQGSGCAISKASALLPFLVASLRSFSIGSDSLKGR